jgi:hypothetical protein
VILVLSLGSGVSPSINISRNLQPGATVKTAVSHPVPTQIRQKQPPVSRSCPYDSRQWDWFLQTDPMGYRDSMNLYQAFNMNSVNFVDPLGEEIDFISLSEPAPSLAPIGTFIANDWKKTKIQVKSWFDDPTNFVEYCAFWLEKYGRHVPGLGAGVKMGSAVNGTTVTGDPLDNYERTDRLLWGEIEFLTLGAADVAEPKPVKIPYKPENDRVYDPLYRRLHPKELENGSIMKDGLVARNPEASTVTPERHVLGEENTPWISTGTDYEVCHSFYNKNNTPIVVIDPSKVSTEIIDFTNPNIVKSYLKTEKAINSVLRDTEVLIKERVLPSAIVRIIWPGGK